MSVATRDITERLPPGTTYYRLYPCGDIVLVVDGIHFGPYPEEDLFYATHMEFEIFYRDLAFELRMPRKMEDSRLWC
jgi:hypothetical protein